MLNFLQPFLLEWEGYIKCHDSVPVVLSPPIKWKCPWSQGYAFLKVLTLNIWLTRGQTSRWKWRKSDSCPEISKYWQYIWMTDWNVHFSCTPVCNYPKLKLSLCVPWFGPNRHNKLPETSPVVLCIPLLIHMDFSPLLLRRPGEYSSTISGTWALSARSDHWSSPAPMSQYWPCHMVGTQCVSGGWNQMTNNALET